MRSAAFSKAILGGLRVHGLSDSEIASISGMSLRDLKSIRAGTRRLRERDLDCIERATGMTGGQLAALTVERDGGPLTKLFDTLAEARSDAEIAARPRR